jgi:hypothetical protein
MTEHQSIYQAFEAQSVEAERIRAKKFFNPRLAESEEAEQIRAQEFFNSPRTSFAPVTQDQFAGPEGSIQFHLIGQKPNDPAMSDIMNENMDILWTWVDWFITI